MTVLQNAFVQANAAFLAAQSDYITAVELAANNPTNRNWAAADKSFQAQQAASAAADKTAQAMHNAAFAAVKA